jgi:hypothetical protein
MQRWGYGTNNLYKTCHVCLEEAPWWLWAIIDGAGWVCDHVPDWRIPFLDRIRLVREGEQTTFAEWYGDTLHSLFCGFVDMPLVNWAWNHPRMKTVSVELSWEHCKRLFYEKDKVRWDEEESDPEFGKFTRPDELSEAELAIYGTVMRREASLATDHYDWDANK